jgi:polyferredoxin
MAIKTPSAGKTAQKKKVKRAKRDIHIRQGVQLGFLALFLLTVLQANYPFAPWIPPELFLWMDPLTAIVVQVAARAFIPMFLLSLIVLVLPFVLGRSFCGWVCPLGTLVDIGDRIVARRDRIGRKLRPFKTWALVAFLVAAVFGFSAVWLLDPLPLIWRTFGGAIFPGITWGLNAAFDTSLAWGYDPDWLFNTFDFLSLHVLPLKAHAVAGAWFIFVFFLVILGLSFFQRRFWCRNLCPLGALLGLLSKFSPLQRVVKSGTCTNCALCTKECKMGAIEDDFVTTEKSECIFCLNCAAQCRAGETVVRGRHGCGPDRRGDGQYRAGPGRA